MKAGVRDVVGAARPAIQAAFDNCKGLGPVEYAPLRAQAHHGTAALSYF